MFSVGLRQIVISEVCWMNIVGLSSMLLICLFSYPQSTWVGKCPLCGTETHLDAAFWLATHACIYSNGLLQTNKQTLSLWLGVFGSVKVRVFQRMHFLNVSMNKTLFFCVLKVGLRVRIVTWAFHFFVSKLIPLINPTCMQFCTHSPSSI